MEQAANKGQGHTGFMDQGMVMVDDQGPGWFCPPTGKDQVRTRIQATSEGPHRQPARRRPRHAGPAACAPLGARRTAAPRPASAASRSTATPASSTCHVCRGLTVGLTASRRLAESQEAGGLVSDIFVTIRVRRNHEHCFRARSCHQDTTVIRLSARVAWGQVTSSTHRCMRRRQATGFGQKAISVE